METLYASLKKSTIENIQRRVENERSRQISHQMKIKNAMTSLFEKIIENVSNDDLMQCANEGYDKCEIFSFQKGETFDDFPLIFLTRGPNNYNGFGLNYFEELNIIPYMKLLQQHFSPLKVYYNTNYKTGKISVFASWSN